MKAVYSHKLYTKNCYISWPESLVATQPEEQAEGASLGVLLSYFFEITLYNSMKN